MYQPRAFSCLSDIASDARAQSTRAPYTAIGTGRVKIIHPAGTDSATAITLVMPWRRFAFIAQNGSSSLPAKLYPARTHLAPKATTEASSVVTGLVPRVSRHVSGNLHACFRDSLCEQLRDVRGFVLGSNGERCASTLDAVSGMFGELGGVPAQERIVGSSAMTMFQNASLFLMPRASRIRYDR